MQTGFNLPISGRLSSREIVTQIAQGDEARRPILFVGICEGWLQA